MNKLDAVAFLLVVVVLPLLIADTAMLYYLCRVVYGALHPLG